MSGPIYRDPWAKREAWRKSPIFSNRQMFRNMFPGLGIATVAFTAYVIYDDYFAPKAAHGGHGAGGDASGGHGHGAEEGHGSGH